MKHQKASVSWQNDRKEQVVIFRPRTGYTRATHRHIIEKTQHTGLPILRCTPNNESYSMAVQ
jgi:hypothetical protein